MGQKFSPDDAALYRAVSDVLLHEWDPIGISSFPEAHDEYYFYLPSVFALVRDGASAEVIGDRLYEVKGELLGNGGARSELDVIVRRLAELTADLHSANETALLSEPALGVDWNRPEEDEAWKDL